MHSMLELGGPGAFCGYPPDDEELHKFGEVMKVGQMM